MVEKIKNFVMEEEGQGMAEYGLILAGVAIVAIAAFYALGGEVDKLIKNVKDRLSTAPTS